METGKNLDYSINKAGNGVYVFVLEGEAVIEGHLLKRRDGAGIEGADTFSIKSETAADVLFIEVPMA